MGKNLTNAEVVRLKKMALEGYTPASISRDLGCAVSTVHHYKDKLRKEEGLQFPQVKGKRPVKVSYSGPQTVPSTVRHVEGADRTRVQATENTVTPVQQTIQFVVNGVTVQVAPGVKSIEIGNNIIHITF